MFLLNSILAQQLLPRRATFTGGGGGVGGVEDVDGPFQKLNGCATKMLIVTIIATKHEAI